MTNPPDQQDTTRRRFVGKTGLPSKSIPSTQGPSSIQTHQGDGPKKGKKVLKGSARTTNQVPIEILQDTLLNKTINELLPRSYNFEIHKTIHQIIQNRVQVVGLQMPEGLLQWSLIISDIIRKFCPQCQDVIVLGDVTYGACCVDDFTAKALGCQMLIHYGHSCLIPVDQTSIRTLYVFVEIGIDREHLRDTIKANFPECLQDRKRTSGPHKNHGHTGDLNRLSSKLNHISIGADEEAEEPTEAQVVNLAVVGTVQFVSAVQALKLDLEREQPPSEEIPKRLMIEHTLSQSTSPIPITDPSSGTQDHEHSPTQSQPFASSSSSSNPCRFRVTVPQIKPLSPGEILGCTAPRLSSEIDAILYVGDGRFHLESIMIANPRIPAYRYDPYEKKITYEGYDHLKMREFRHRAIQIASKSLASASSLENQDRDDSLESNVGRKDWAIVLGTLGRQGSLSVFKSITDGVKRRTNSKKETVGILISELTKEKLNLFKGSVDVFVQTSCPRLSIDWGDEFLIDLPLLNPYESKVSLDQAHQFKVSDPSLDALCDDPNLLDTYPMDFYADDSLGDWTPRFGKGRKSLRNV